MQSNWQLYAHEFCPHSRAASLLLHEMGIEFEFIEELYWERRSEFLILNPQGHIPVLRNGDSVICGVASLCEFFLEYDTHKKATQLLMPEHWRIRSEIRRLRDWFDIKFGEEVSHALSFEHVFKRQMGAQGNGSAPDTTVLRLIGQNLKSHISYCEYLIADSGWMVGEKMSAVDLIAAAHFSIVDYFGLIKWSDHQALKDWYQWVKSRPSFQHLLHYRILGVKPPDHYTQLDF